MSSIPSMIDTSKLVPKAGSYRIAVKGAITDLTLLDIATQYETQVSRKMIALLPEQIPKRYAGSDPVLETTKIDGVGVFIYFERGKPLFAFNAPSGRVQVGLPALIKLEEHLQQSSVQKGLFRAELYLPYKIANRRAGVAEVIRVSFNGSEAEIAALTFLMLDIIMLDGKDLRPNQDDFQKNWEILQEIFGTDRSAPFHSPVGSILPESDLPELFARKIAEGEEGIVIHRLNRMDICKVKPRLTIDAAVIGYVEGEFEGQYGVTSMLVALTYPQSDQGLSFQTLVRIGSGLTDDQRAEFLNLFSSLRVDNPIVMTDSDGRPISFIRPDYIVEVSAEDLMANVPGSDRPNQTQQFDWDPTTGSYRFVGLFPCPRPTFATFVRLRQDKSLLEGGARLEQLMPDPQKPTPKPEIAQQTQVLRRDVYMKGEMVRKLVVVQKSGEEGEVVPYLVYWTDYSPNRKDPLKVSLSCAFTETRATELAEQLIADNIVRGWHPAGEPAPPPKSKTKAKSKAHTDSDSEAENGSEAKPKAKKTTRKSSKKQADASDS